ncbi:MAG: hypothetical protein DME10_27810 [Candidatus Rokuibacteriota bacterium]|nr:MAG: hypothetical protein DME10_27810 [Candidatus Rokubacteria bacterium]
MDCKLLAPESLPGMRRDLFFLGAFLALAAQAVASDWAMGDANSRIAPPSMLRPVSTPAHEISTLAIFVLGVTTAIFVIVSGLLTYSVIRFRSRRPDDGSEPPQIYGSGPVEFAWTAVPVLIVFVLILVTARSIYSVQAVRRPPHALSPGRPTSSRTRRTSLLVGFLCAYERSPDSEVSARSTTRSRPARSCGRRRVDAPRRRTDTRRTREAARGVSVGRRRRPSDDPGERHSRGRDEQAPVCGLDRRRGRSLGTGGGHPARG